MPHFASEHEAKELTAPTDRPFVEYWLTTDRGFGLRIMRPRKANGAVRRVWIYRFMEAGKDRKPVIGEVGELTMRQAQAKALDARQRVERRRRGRTAANTLYQAYQDYVAMRQSDLSVVTKLNYEKAMKRLMPLWRRRVDEITDDHVQHRFLQIIRDVCKGKRAQKLTGTDRDRAGRAAAIASMRLLKAIYAPLVKRGVVATCPVQGLCEANVFKRQPKRSGAIHRSQLPVFWGWLKTHAHPSVRDYLLVTLLLALRKSVADSLTWSCLDTTIWTYSMLPDQRGNKTREFVPVPIPQYLVTKVFEPRRRIKAPGAKWIIESPKHPGSPLRSVRGSLEALKRDTGIDISLHDLRRTIATLAHAATGSELLTGRVLTHNLAGEAARESTGAGYIITGQDEGREALEKTVKLLLQIVGEAEDPECLPVAA